MKNIPLRRKRQKTPPNCRLGSCDQFFGPEYWTQIAPKSHLPSWNSLCFENQRTLANLPKDDKLYLDPQKLRVEKTLYTFFILYEMISLWGDQFNPFFGCIIFFLKGVNSQQYVSEKPAPPGAWSAGTMDQLPGQREPTAFGGEPKVSEVTVGTTDQTSHQLKPLKAWCFEDETLHLGKVSWQVLRCATL